MPSRHVRSFPSRAASRITALAFMLVLAGCGAQSSPVPVMRQSPVVGFMGDSITAAWGYYDSLYPLLGTDNFGVTGDTTAGMLARFQRQVIDAEPPIGTVVISGGINDWLLPSGEPVTVDHIAQMAAMAHQAGIRVLIGSVMLEHLDGYPNPSSDEIDAFDSALSELCARHGYGYVNYKDVMLLPDGQEDFSLYVDGLHPNADGYARMWPVLEQALVETP